MKKFRIKVDLSKFFGDERKLAFIIVDPQWATVSCLQEHVEEIFEIQNVRFTTDEGCFLPPLESIKVVQPGDVLLTFAPSDCSHKKRKKTTKSQDLSNCVVKKCHREQASTHNDTAVRKRRVLKERKTHSLETGFSSSTPKEKKQSGHVLMETSANNTNNEITSTSEQLGISDQQQQSKSTKGINLELQEYQPDQSNSCDIKKRKHVAEKVAKKRKRHREKNHETTSQENVHIKANALKEISDEKMQTNYNERIKFPIETTEEISTQNKSITIAENDRSECESGIQEASTYENAEEIAQKILFSCSLFDVSLNKPRAFTFNRHTTGDTLEDTKQKLLTTLQQDSERSAKSPLIIQEVKVIAQCNSTTNTNTEGSIQLGKNNDNEDEQSMVSIVEHGETQCTINYTNSVISEGDISSTNMRTVDLETRIGENDKDDKSEEGLMEQNATKCSNKEKNSSVYAQNASTNVLTEVLQNLTIEEGDQNEKSLESLMEKSSTELSTENIKSPINEQDSSSAKIIAEGLPNGNKNKKLYEKSIEKSKKQIAPKHTNSYTKKTNKIFSKDKDDQGDKLLESFIEKNESECLKNYSKSLTSETETAKTKSPRELKDISNSEDNNQNEKTIELDAERSENQSIQIPDDSSIISVDSECDYEESEEHRGSKQRCKNESQVSEIIDLNLSDDEPEVSNVDDPSQQHSSCQKFNISKMLPFSTDLVSLPTVGEIVIFNVKRNDGKVSKNIAGRCEYVNKRTKNIKLCVLAGQDEIDAIPNSYLSGLDDSSASDKRILQIKLKDMVEPKSFFDDYKQA